MERLKALDEQFEDEWFCEQERVSRSLQSEGLTTSSKQVEGEPVDTADATDAREQHTAADMEQCWILTRSTTGGNQSAR